MSMAAAQNEGEEMQGAPVIILTGEFKGEEGVCLGKSGDGQGWAVSPVRSEKILTLAFEKDFGLLVDLSANPSSN
jgi:hypothetical protein